jgi:hypothetical protein
VGMTDESTSGSMPAPPACTSSPSPPFVVNRRWTSRRRGACGICKLKKIRCEYFVARERRAVSNCEHNEGDGATPCVNCRVGIIFPGRHPSADKSK